MEIEPENLPISKSQRKRDAHAVFDIARKLVEGPEKDLKQWPISADIIAVVLKARQIKAHIARKREIQYLAKLLRSEDLSQLEELLEQRQQTKQAEDQSLHKLEAWRARLLEEPVETLNQLCAHDHSIDRQRIRSLARQAIKEQAEQRSPKAFRQLFAALREIEKQQPLPEPPID